MMTTELLFALICAVVHLRCHLRIKVHIEFELQ
jgi:hypothetical protein